MRARLVIPLFLVGALVLPGLASAHGRTATIALDYRLVLDPASRVLPGLSVRILDGDRDLELRAAPGVVVIVRGALGEPVVRIDARGVWANAGSPTATGDKIVATGRKGWVRLSGGNSIIWHDHRLGPPPISTVGRVGVFRIPIELDGRPALIAGTFYRVARPSFWPWLLAGLLAIAGIVLATRRRSLRAPLTIGLGLAGGLAALTAVTTFAARDAPTGGVGWLQIGTGIVIAVVLGVILVRLRGRARVHAAGVVGGIAAAVSLSSLSVFWHGVIISLLPALLARSVCGIALVAGAAAAALSFLPDFDEPARAVRR